MREKLIELLDVAATIANNICSGIACEDCDGYNNGCTLNHMADHLIANGVTIQKWIPVTERLPEEEKTVLCLKDSGDCWLARWNYCDDQLWSDGEYWCSKNGVTHWMPLPEAPKGE